jgi:hypothetical protein
MKRQLLKVAAVLLLLSFAVLLYADLQSIHQIYRITDATISRAPDEQTRKALIVSRDERDRGERTHKLQVIAALAIDVALLLFVASSLFRRRSAGGQSIGAG